MDKTGHLKNPADLRLWQLVGAIIITDYGWDLQLFIIKVDHACQIKNVISWKLKKGNIFLINSPFTNTSGEVQQVFNSSFQLKEQ